MKKINVVILTKEGAQRATIGNDLESLYKAIDCDNIEIYDRVILDKSGKPITKKYFDFICDGEGRFKDNNFMSAVANGNVEFVGNLVITNHNEEGETTSLTEKEIETILESVQKRLFFTEYGVDIVHYLELDYYLD